MIQLSISDSFLFGPSFQKLISVLSQVPCSFSFPPNQHRSDDINYSQLSLFGKIYSDPNAYKIKLWSSTDKDLTSVMLDLWQLNIIFNEKGIKPIQLLKGQIIMIDEIQQIQEILCLSKKDINKRCQFQRILLHAEIKNNILCARTIIKAHANNFANLKIKKSISRLCKFIWFFKMRIFRSLSNYFTRWIITNCKQKINTLNQNIVNQFYLISKSQHSLLKDYFLAWKKYSQRVRQQLQ